MRGRANKIVKKVLPVLLIMALLVGIVPAVSAEQTISVQVNGLLVYSAPDVNSVLIAVMSLGSSIVVTDTAQQNGFNEVRLPDGRLGWAQLTATGVPGVQTPTGETASLTGIVIEARGNVRIRELPSLNARQIGIIGWGERASVVNVDPSRDWYQVQFEGITGWVASVWFVTVVGDIVFDDIALGVGGGGTASGVLDVRALGNVRIRQEPSLNSPKIGNIGWGQTARLLAADASGDWIQIEFEGIVGWSASIWFELVGDDDVILVTDPGQNVTEVVGAPTVTVDIPGSSGVVMMAVGNVLLRAQPNVNAARIGSVGWGTIVEALAVSSDGNWYLISADGVIGWSAGVWYQLESGNLGALPVR